MSFVVGLECRECGEKYPQSPRHVCASCFGLLDIQYDLPTIKKSLSRDRIAARTEGIFTEPAGGAEVAVTKKLIDQGRIPGDESIVISITGSGYKSLEAVAPAVERPFKIDAMLAKFDMLFARLSSRPEEQPPGA